MGLGKFVISCADLLTLSVIFTLSVSVELTEALNLIEILCLFFLKLGDFKEKSIDVFAELVAIVGLLSDVSLKSGDIGFLASNLVASGTEILLNVGNNTALLIHQERKIITLFL